MHPFIHRASIAVLFLSTLAAFTPAQETKTQEPSAASLIEQGQFAEEQERDFEKAAQLYERARAAASLAGDSVVLTRATTFRDRVKARAAGINPAPVQSGSDPDRDPMTCRLSERLFDIAHFGSGTYEQDEAFRDLALLGAIAVPWLEKAIVAPYKLCSYEIGSSPPIYVRAIAQMSAPEGIAALEKLLSSPDPIARRAVAEFADPERHRAILLRALKDPAQAVRDQAIETLRKSGDPKLFEVMAAAAREGSDMANDWLGLYRPEELVRIGATAALSTTVRARAITALNSAKDFRPDAASIDALLALARVPNENTLRNAAMGCLVHGASEGWKPFAPDLARRIDTAITTTPDAYPPKYLMSALQTVGSAASLAVLIERTASEDLNSLATPINRILARSATADFPAVAAAFAKAPIPVRGNQMPATDWLHQFLRGWLEAMAATDMSTAEIANPAKSLPAGQRRVYLERVVIAWMQANINTDAAIAKVPKFDPGFIELLRELATSGDQNQVMWATRGMGASRDPKLLPDLMSMVTGNELDGTVAEAIRRITRSDPQRVRTVLALLLANKSLTTDGFSNAFKNTVEKPKPEELLPVLNSLWSPANSERLIALVAASVPGPEGSQVLLAHYPELDVGAAETRMRVIQRLGQELYEPALDLIGSALRDPNDRVRNTASQVFERFKSERQRLNEFNEWRNSNAQSKQTIDELIPLLDNANTDIVVGAVKALAALKARACYPKLVLLLEKYKGDEKVKAALMQAIDQLGQ